VLKHFENTGEPDADLPLMQWAAQDALFNTQIALKGVMKNLPVPLIGRLLNMLVFPLTKPYQLPKDSLGHKVARLLMQPSATLDRLSKGIYVNNDPADATGRILYAQDCVLDCAELEQRLRDAQKKGILDNSSDYHQARNNNIIDDAELARLQQTSAAVRNAIIVDEFSFEGWQLETPQWAQAEKSISLTAVAHRN
jgi:acyl-CoA dehydrogenase